MTAEVGKRCPYCCKTHQTQTTALKCRRAHERRAVSRRPVIDGDECETFIGGFDIDPNQPNRCQVCARSRDEHANPKAVTSALAGARAR